MKKKINFKVIIVILLIISVTVFYFYMKKGKDTNQGNITRIELEDMREANKKVYLNSDGTRTERIYQQSIHYKNGDKFKEIDNTLVPQKINGGDRLLNKDNNIKLSLGLNSKSEKLIKMNFDNYNINFEPCNKEKQSDKNIKVLCLNKKDIEENSILDLNNTEKEISSNIDYDICGLQYENIYIEDMSLQYIPMPDGIKENIILHKYNGQNVFQFNLQLENLIPESIEQGGIVLRDKDSNEEKAFIARPFIHDSSKEEKESDNNSINIEKLGENEYKISISIDKEFLESTETAYPVIIDPYVTKLTTKHSTLGSCIKSKYPDMNFSGDPYLRVGNWTGSDPSGIMYSYLKFDNMPNIGSDKLISATLNIYSDYEGTGDMTVETHRISSSWDYKAVKWNKRPSWDDNVEDKRVVSGINWFKWNVTSLVKKVLDNEVPDYGIMIKKNDNAAPTFKKFNSPNNTSNTPYLEVMYKVPETPREISITTNKADEFLNESKGYINLSWSKVDDADGYIVQMWDGSKYCTVDDVGNKTNWSSKERKLWPTRSEIDNGKGELHLNDNEGSDYLPDNPHPVYLLNKQAEKGEENTYFFRVQSYYSIGDNKVLSNVDLGNGIKKDSVKLPDTTAPEQVKNIKLDCTLDSDGSNWSLKCNWDATKDNPEEMAVGIKNYVVELYDSKNEKIETKESIEPETTFPLKDDNSQYKIKVIAYDKNGNHSECESNMITTGSRKREQISYKINKENISVGDTFEINVMAKDFSNVEGAALDFKYDENQFEVVDIIQGEIWKGNNLYKNKVDRSNKEKIISAYCLKINENIDIKDDAIFTIKLKALKASDLDLDNNIKIKISNSEGKSIKYISKKCSINIK